MGGETSKQSEEEGAAPAPAAAASAAPAAPSESKPSAAPAAEEGKPAAAPEKKEPASPKKAASPKQMPAPKQAASPKQAPSPKQAASPKQGGEGKESASPDKKPLPPGEVKQGETPAEGEGKPAKGKGKGKSEGKGKGKGKSEGAKLCVKNLPEDATSESLKAMFEPHGTVVHADVKTEKEGKCRGFGFVTLSSMEEATKAKEALNGTTAGEKTLFVDTAERRKRDEGEDGGKSKGKGKDKGGEKGAKGKGKGSGKGKTAATGPAAAYNAAYTAMYHQSMSSQMNQMSQMSQMYSYPSGYSMGMYGYPYYNPAVMSQYAAAAAAASPAAAGAASYATPSAGWTASSPGFGALSTTKDYEGSLKSLSEKNGYGFIVCEETWSLYGRDVYVGKDELPEGAKVLDRLKFSVTLNAKQHPKAENVKIVSTTAAAASTGGSG